MKNDWTFKKLFEEILRIETEYKLFEQEINGVYFWKLIRFGLFMELAKKLNLSEDGHPQSKIEKNRYLNLLRRLIKGTVNTLMPNTGNVDIILFPHGRKVNVDSKSVDIYTYHLEEKWQQNAINYLTVDKAHNEPLNFFYLWKYFRQKRKLHIDFSSIGIATIANIPISEIKTLSKENISSVVSHFTCEYDYYTKILTRYSPKTLYTVVAYNKASLISAANDLGIETIEIQHGTITSFHIGYSYPANIKIPYFPENLRLWGKFWSDISKLPIDEKSISYDGFPFLNQEVKKYSNLMRDEFRILLISAGPYGKLLVDLVLEFVAKNKKFKVVYRLHPSEVEQWKVLYPKLYTASIKYNNIFIEIGMENPLYKSFAESKYVVGVSSTALIESLVAGCKLILIDLPGVEYFQDLVDKKLVKKVENVDQLLNILEDEDEDEVIIDSDYFFVKNLKSLE